MSITNEARALRARRRTEKTAKALIYGAAILTIATLFCILGFIVVRGLYASNIRTYDVASFSEESFDGLRLAVNKRIRIKEITFASLLGAYTGSYIDWGKLSEQDFDMVPVLYGPGSAEDRAVRAALGIRAGDYSPMAESADSSEEVLRKVASTNGAFALVPAGATLPSGVKAVRIRRVVLALNPSVSELVGNIALKTLDEKAAVRIASGYVANWQEAGGRDLKVIPVPVSAGSPLAALTQAKTSDVSSAEADRVERIAAQEGAAGWAYWKDARRLGLPIMNLQRVEREPNLTPSFLYEAPKMSGRVGGISTIIVNTLLMIVLTLLIATPVGVAAAIYLVEYAKQGRLVSLLRLGTETLAGIPSIIFGLFGMLFFVTILGWGIGLLSGVMTVTLMILPTIVRTSEEALKTVPAALREGSLALGATKLQTVVRVVVPAASPGILTGMILAIGRAVGETAALVFTLGSSYEAARSLFSSARVLAVHVYLIIAEGISLDKAFSTATILVLIILAVNTAATRLIGRMNGMSGK